MTAEWIQAWASIGQTFIGLGLIIITSIGLKQMRTSSEHRNRQLDRMEEESTLQMATLRKLLEEKS